MNSNTIKYGLGSLIMSYIAYYLFIFIMPLVLEFSRFLGAIVFVLMSLSLYKAGKAGYQFMRGLLKAVPRVLGVTISEWGTNRGATIGKLRLN